MELEHTADTWAHTAFSINSLSPVWRRLRLLRHLHVILVHALVSLDRVPNSVVHAEFLADESHLLHEQFDHALVSHARVHCGRHSAAAARRRGCRCRRWRETINWARGRPKRTLLKGGLGVLTKGLSPGTAHIQGLCNNVDPRCSRPGQTLAILHEYENNKLCIMHQSTVNWLAVLLTVGQTVRLTKQADRQIYDALTK